MLVASLLFAAVFGSASAARLPSKHLAAHTARLHEKNVPTNALEFWAHVRKHSTPGAAPAAAKTNHIRAAASKGVEPMTVGYLDLTWDMNNMDCATAMQDTIKMSSQYGTCLAGEFDDEGIVTSGSVLETLIDVDEMLFNEKRYDTLDCTGNAVDENEYSVYQQCFAGITFTGLSSSFTASDGALSQVEYNSKPSCEGGVSGDSTSVSFAMSYPQDFCMWGIYATGCDEEIGTLNFYFNSNNCTGDSVADIVTDDGCENDDLYGYGDDFYNDDDDDDDDDGDDDGGWDFEETAWTEYTCSPKYGAAGAGATVSLLAVSATVMATLLFL